MFSQSSTTKHFGESTADNTLRHVWSSISSPGPLRTSQLNLRANCTMQPNAGPSSEDNRRYGPIYNPPGGQAQAQQQQSQQQQTPRREGPAPIAPAPEGFSRSASGATSASAMTPSGIAASREIPARPKRKLINLACTACQKRKSKVRCIAGGAVPGRARAYRPHKLDLT